MNNYSINLIEVWRGLETWRSVMLELLACDISKINQASLDLLFPLEGLKMEPNKKRDLIIELEKQKKSLDPSSDLYLSLEAELQNLRDLQEELCVSKVNGDFIYKFVLKAEIKQINLSGFAKILNSRQPQYRALLSWQNKSRTPILFLAEQPELNQCRFHINFPDAGMAIIWEDANSYIWTHVMKSNYSEMKAEDFGSIGIDKTNQKITLRDSNIAAATALSKAQTRSETGETLFENNIKLMLSYKQELANLDFGF